MKTLRNFEARSVTAVCAFLVACSAPDERGTEGEVTSELTQHQEANEYAFWDFSGAHGFWNVDQVICIDQKAPATYWAQLWYWEGQSYGGYIGLQTNGHRFDGTVGDTAIFSLWNADAASGPSCASFGGEGEGKSCRAAYPIAPGSCHRLRVWRLDAEVSGQWWGGWIRNEATGVEQSLGAIRVASAATLMQPPSNFSEYFGPQRSCSTVPVSVARFTQPAANQLEPGIYEHGSSFDRGTRARCTGGRITEVDLGWTKAAEVVLGGR